MVEITCHCGYSANYNEFLKSGPFVEDLDRRRSWLRARRPPPPPTSGPAWWRCPKCGDKFRGPAGVSEIGVQVIRDGIRSEIPPADKVIRELREWWRDQASARKEAASQTPRVGRQLQKSFPFET